MKTLARPHDTNELVQRLRTLRPDSTRRWGRMSAHQMVCHLSDSFRMASGEKPVNCAPEVRRSILIKWIALYGPLPWPAGISTVPEVDAELGGTAPIDFAGDLADAEARLERFARRRRVSWPAHPIFGPMSEPEWLRWGYLHTDHHLRQFGL